MRALRAAGGKCVIFRVNASPAPQDAHDMLAPASRTAEQEYFVLGTSVHYRSSLPVAVRTPNV